MNEINKSVQKQSRNENFADMGAALVISGVILETIFTFAFQPSAPFWEKLLTLIAGALVAIGVLMEFRFGGNARAEANAREAEANRMAAEARERTAAIEKLTAWRRVDQSKIDGILSSILPFAEEVDLLVEFQRDDPEAFLYAKEILNIFWRAGVPHVRSCANSYLEGNIFGVCIGAASTLGIENILAAFIDAGIEMQKFEKDLSTHLPRNEVAPNLYIFVGPKPPPPMLSVA